MKKQFFLLICLLTALTISIDGCRERAKQVSAPQEDLAAKKMLQGIWVNEDEESVAFEAQGDSIFYPDTTSQPVRFQIVEDTLVLHGAEDIKYPIIKQTPHLFIFKNQNGDEVKLEKSDDPDDAVQFTHQKPKAVNQNQLIKRDTIVSYNNVGYHCYVTVNPTTYKVVKASYNDEGVEVDNVYYDNIVNLNVYHGATKLFSGDFRKQQFKHIVPEDFLGQSILSDLIFDSIDQLTVSYTGHLQMRLK